MVLFSMIERGNNTIEKNTYRALSLVTSPEFSRSTPEETEPLHDEVFLEFLKSYKPHDDKNVVNRQVFDLIVDYFLIDEVDLDLVGDVERHHVVLDIIEGRSARHRKQEFKEQRSGALAELEGEIEGRIGRLEVDEKDFGVNSEIALEEQKKRMKEGSRVLAVIGDEVDPITKQAMGYGLAQDFGANDISDMVLGEIEGEQGGGGVHLEVCGVKFKFQIMMPKEQGGEAFMGMMIDDELVGYKGIKIEGGPSVIHDAQARRRMMVAFVGEYMTKERGSRIIQKQKNYGVRMRAYGREQYGTQQEKAHVMAINTSADYESLKKAKSSVNRRRVIATKQDELRRTVGIGTEMERG